MLFEYGDEGKYFYIMLDGLVDLIIPDEKKEEETILSGSRFNKEDNISRLRKKSKWESIRDQNERKLNESAMSGRESNVDFESHMGSEEGSNIDLNESVSHKSTHCDNAESMPSPPKLFKEHSKLGNELFKNVPRLSLSTNK